jgi:hypothetical protein
MNRLGVSIGDRVEHGPCPQPRSLRADPLGARPYRVAPPPPHERPRVTYQRQVAAPRRRHVAPAVPPHERDLVQVRVLSFRIERLPARRDGRPAVDRLRLRVRTPKGERFTARVVIGGPVFVAGFPDIDPGELLGASERDVRRMLLGRVLDAHVPRDGRPVFRYLRPAPPADCEARS